MLTSRIIQTLHVDYGCSRGNHGHYTLLLPSQDPSIVVMQKIVIKDVQQLQSQPRDLATKKLSQKYIKSLKIQTFFACCLLAGGQANLKNEELPISQPSRPSRLRTAIQESETSFLFVLEPKSKVLDQLHVQYEALLGHISMQGQ